MSESLDAVVRRVEAARAARERIDAARQARDDAEQGKENAEAGLHAKLRERNPDYPGAFNVLPDTKHNRMSGAAQMRNAGHFVIFETDLDWQAVRAADLKYDNAHAEYDAELYKRLPEGWEGNPDGPDFIMLADVETWLNERLSSLRSLKGFPPTEKVATALAGSDIRNFYRVLDHLGIYDRPKRVADPADANQAEATLSDLLAWVRRRLNIPQTLAELRVRLKLAGDYASAIAEPPSMDGVEEAGDQAAHILEARIRQCERRAWRRLSAFLVHEFLPLADRIVDTIGRDKFPDNPDPPLESPGGIPAHNLAAGLFGLEYSDLSLAGKLLLVWSAWAHRDGKVRPLGWRDQRYLPWASALVSRRSGDPTAPCVLGQPFNWALAAFDELANERVSSLPPEREPMLTPEVRAALEPLRAIRELEREREIKAARDFLIKTHPTWTLLAIDCYLASPSNLATTLERIQSSNSANDQEQAPAAGGSEQGEGAGEQGEARTLPPSRLKAYGQYLDAVRRKPELASATDREVYDAVKEQLDSGESLPMFGTWSKYVRQSRSHQDANKHNRRVGREHGKSVVRRDQI